jgi:very-short-patch-repair endonuclease
MQHTLNFWNTPIVHLADWRIGLALAALIVVSVLLWQMQTLVCRISALPRKNRARQKSILTDNETEFYSRLTRALPDFHVWPQVGMGALLSSTDWSVQRKYQNKVCDYVVAKKGAPKGQGVVAVIELDDRTHDANKDRERDALLASAGIKTIRWESRAKPNERQIREQILALG